MGGFAFVNECEEIVSRLVLQHGPHRSGEVRTKPGQAPENASYLYV